MSEEVDDLEGEAADIANAIEAAVLGRQSAAVIYALGMVLAHGVADSPSRDVDATMRILRRIIEDELARQWPEERA